MFYLIILSALAHKPSFGESYVSAETAYSVSDPDVSIVVYQEITCDKPELWLTFDAPEDFELYVQLGVPVMDWLDGYQPMVAVIAEGLPPAADLPFDIPEGMGAIVYEASSRPDNFYEPFTQTSSWVWVEERLNVSGTGYIVGWHPENMTGKIWLATGETEDFSDVSFSDFAYWTEAVNNFHETGKFELPEPKETQSCNDVEPEKSTSCSMLSNNDYSTVMLLSGFIALLFQRRRTKS